MEVLLKTHTKKLLNKGQNKWKAQHCQKKFEKVSKTFNFFFLKYMHVRCCSVEMITCNRTAIHRIHFPVTPKLEARDGDLFI